MSAPVRVLPQAVDERVDPLQHQRFTGPQKVVLVLGPLLFVLLAFGPAPAELAGAPQRSERLLLARSESAEDDRVVKYARDESGTRVLVEEGV